MDAEQQYYATVPAPLTNTKTTSRSAKKRNNKSNSELVKRTVKYLSVASDPKAYSAVVRGAPDSVIKTIANAAYNVERGDINLSPAQKALFRHYRKQIATLTSAKVPVARKRKVIQSQKGGFPFLPLIIGSALGFLGNRLFGGAQQQPQPQQQ